MRLTDKELDALMEAHFKLTKGESCNYCYDAEWPCETYLLATEVRDLQAVRDAADRMAMAYAGEMAAKAAGIDVQGFPLLDAYQAFMVALARYEEGCR